MNTSPNNITDNNEGKQSDQTKLNFDPSRLKKDNNVYDAALIKQNCPDIPDDVIARLLFGGR